ncbi:hypothetical protein GCM10023184_29020 [Flaviaesturariibacter amylovorans]|uniref:DUF4158 domain-containing protein n=1 Tax=Flaviaesturariibacter amylovorans TaxID=1084520 RepID=A0ABP8H5K7_9BACT
MPLKSKSPTFARMTKKSIQIDDFDRLSLEEQIALLHSSATYIGKRKHEGYYYVLLQLFGFYAEIRYEFYRVEVNAIRTSIDSSIIDPYLSQIRVRGLDDDTKRGTSNED